MALARAWQMSFEPSDTLICAFSSLTIIGTFEVICPGLKSCATRHRYYKTAVCVFPLIRPILTSVATFSFSSVLTQKSLAMAPASISGMSLSSFKKTIPTSLDLRTTALPTSACLLSYCSLKTGVNKSKSNASVFCMIAVCILLPLLSLFESVPALAVNYAHASLVRRSISLGMARPVFRVSLLKSNVAIDLSAMSIQRLCELSLNVQWTILPEERRLMRASRPVLLPLVSPMLSARLRDRDLCLPSDLVTLDYRRRPLCLPLLSGNSTISNLYLS